MIFIKNIPKRTFNSVHIFRGAGPENLGSRELLTSRTTSGTN